MGNSGRQVAGEKRLATLHQRILPDGPSGVKTATPFERAAELAEEAPSRHRARYGFTVRYVTPKGRRAIPAQDQANSSTESPSDEPSASPLFEDKSVPTDQASTVEEISEERLGQKRRGGPDDLYDTSGDEGVIPGPGSMHAAVATYEEPNTPATIAQGLHSSNCPEDGHKAMHGPASKSDQSDEDEDAHLTGRQTTQRLNSARNLAPGVVAGRIHDTGMQPAFSVSRVPKAIRLRKQITELEHHQPPKQPVASFSTHLSEEPLKDPPVLADKMGRSSSVERDISEDGSSSASGQPSKYNSADLNSLCPEYFPTLEDVGSAARIRAPGWNFQAKKLRGRSEPAATSVEAEVELSVERAQQLKDLSGDDMATAAGLYPRGYRIASRSQQTSHASSRANAKKRQTSGDTMSSITFDQQMRHFDKQTQRSSLERGIKASRQCSELLHEKRATSLVGDEDQNAMNMSRSISPHMSWPLRPPGRAPGPLALCELLSQKLASQDRDGQGHKKDNIRVEDGQEAEIDGNSLHTEDGTVSSDSDITEANHGGENSGTGPVPHRGMQGFTNQENVRPRNPPPNASRLLNGKLGSGSGWGAFGMPLGGAPGLQTMQQRNMAGNGAMGSFTQTTAIGGSQPATPLDPSEFPSLSGAPQTQQQNPGQAIWAQRPTQQNPTANQRQQPSQASQQNPSQGQQQSQAAPEDMFSAPSHFSTRPGEFGQGNQPLSGSVQPQTGSIDEFPPLGRESSAGLSQERRGSILQNSAFGGYGASMAFAGMAQQQRNPLSNALDRERMASPAGSGMGLISSSRSPNSQGPNGGAGQEKLGTIGSGAESSSRQGDFSNPSAQQHPHQSSQMMNSTFGGSDIVDSPSSMPQGGLSSLEQMSDIDRFGLAGLLAMMHHPSPDLRSLTSQGQDLTALGLDLTSTEPLHTQLASVFNPNAHTRLPLDADYTLPACYRVANVQPLHERIPSFSEETLFYIFYSSPKDLVQELVADELIGRKWRFHKGEKMWVTRDENYPAPVEVEREISEQGFYIWWDWKGWKKVRRQYILRYEDLDNGATRNGSALNQMALSAAPSALAQAAGVFSR